MNRYDGSLLTVSVPASWGKRATTRFLTRLRRSMPGLTVTLRPVLPGETPTLDTLAAPAGWLAEGAAPAPTPADLETAAAAVAEAAQGCEG